MSILLTALGSYAFDYFEHDVWIGVNGVYRAASEELLTLLKRLKKERGESAAVSAYDSLMKDPKVGEEKDANCLLSLPKRISNIVFKEWEVEELPGERKEKPGAEKLEETKTDVVQVNANSVINLSYLDAMLNHTLQVIIPAMNAEKSYQDKEKMSGALEQLMQRPGMDIGNLSITVKQTALDAVSRISHQDVMTMLCQSVAATWTKTADEKLSICSTLGLIKASLLIFGSMFQIKGCENDEVQVWFTVSLYIGYRMHSNTRLKAIECVILSVTDLMDLYEGQRLTKELWLSKGKECLSKLMELKEV